jgi:hypothetical protein
LNSLGIQAVIMFIVFFVFLIVYVKMASTGKLMCHFVENKRSWSKLLKEDRENNCVYLGKTNSETREKYIIDPNTMTYTAWPGGMPSFLQTDVRTLHFIRHVETPYDPARKVKSKITAQYLNLVTDVASMQADWRDTRESQGLKKGGGGRFEVWILMGVAITVFVAIYSMYVNMQSQSVLKQIFETLHGVTPK